jgi:hypothetical protein
MLRSGIGGSAEGDGFLSVSCYRNRGTERTQTNSSVGCGSAEGLKWLVPFPGSEGKVLGLDIELLHAESVSESMDVS